MFINYSPEGGINKTSSNIKHPVALRHELRQKYANSLIEPGFPEFAPVPVVSVDMDQSIGPGIYIACGSVFPRPVNSSWQVQTPRSKSRSKSPSALV
jgi:hypothetical protein